MTEITVDITKLKPFNCKYYSSKTLLSKSSCIGYCNKEDDLNLKYCKGYSCKEYEKKEEIMK